MQGTGQTAGLGGRSVTEERAWAVETRGEGREGTVWSMDEAGHVLAREGWPQHLARPLAGAAGPPRLPRALRVAGSGLFILAPESVVIWACRAGTSSVGLQSSLPVFCGQREGAVGGVIGAQWGS